MRNNYTQTITWHRFPSSKPTEMGFYLCTVVFGDEREVREIYFDSDIFIFDEGKITAWAELPEPFEELVIV